MNKYILTAACGLAFSAASAQTKALPDHWGANVVAAT